MCKERGYVYYLPNEDGEKEECITKEDGKKKYVEQRKIL